MNHSIPVGYEWDDTFENSVLNIFSAYKVFNKMLKRYFLIKVHLKALIGVPQYISYLSMVYMQVDKEKRTDELMTILMSKTNWWTLWPNWCILLFWRKNWWTDEQRDIF